MNKKSIRNLIINLLLLLSPLWFVISETGINPEIFRNQIIFFEVMTVLIIGLFHFNKWIGLFLILSASHYFILKPPLFEIYLIPITAACLIYHFVATIFSISEKRIQYKKIILTILTWTLFLFLLQKFGVDILFFNNIKGESAGTFTLPSYMGIFSAITFPIMFMWFWPLSIINICLVLFSKSFFAVIGLIFGLLICLRNIKQFILFMIIPIIILFAFKFDQKFGNGNDGLKRRIECWKMVTSSAFRSPFFGRGIGSVEEFMFIEFRGDKSHYFSAKIHPLNIEPTKKKILDIAKQEKVDTTRIENIHFKEQGAPFVNMKDIMDDLRGKPNKSLNGYVWKPYHNEYLTIFFMWGIAGLSIVFAYIKDILVRYNKVNDKLKTNELKALLASFISTLIISIAHFPLEIPRLSITIIFLFAILDAKLKKLTLTRKD